MKKSQLDIELITRHFLHETDNTENEMIRKIITDDVQSRKKFEEYLEVWEKSADLKDFDKLNVDEDWRNVQSRMKFAPASKKLPLRSYLLRIAAIVVFTLGLAYFLHTITQTTITSTDYIEYSALDEAKDVRLQDGTLISLNKNSKIISNTNYGGTNRDIILEGEAFFEVAKNPKLPFRVFTQNSTIEVLGTSFNIRNDSTRVIVGVLTGKVAFYETQNSNNRLELTPEHTGYYDIDRKVLVDQNALDINMIAWKTKRLVFKKAPVGDVLMVIAGYFGKELLVEEGVPVSATFNGNFEQQSLDQMLEIINLTLTEKLEMEATTDRIIVRKQ